MIEWIALKDDRFKFRFWHPVDKVMHYDIVPGYYKGVVIKDGILMQCTGLKDKNEKLIYEGDILQYEFIKCLVKWESQHACFFGVRDFFYYFNTEDTLRRIILPISFPVYEIIGNEYEHPDLLINEKEKNK